MEIKTDKNRYFKARTREYDSYRIRIEKSVSETLAKGEIILAVEVKDIKGNWGDETDDIYMTKRQIKELLWILIRGYFF